MMPIVLRRYLRDSVRIETYVQQRFRSSEQPPDDDVLRYDKEHPGEFTLNGVRRLIDEVRAQQRERVIATRHGHAWPEGLRRRSTVSVVYVPGR
jgi:hypothetical protein